MIGALLLVVALVSNAYAQTLTETSCSSRRYVDIGAGSANVLIGGLFPMRQKGYGNYGCGPVGNEPVNMQAFEAVRFAISRINGNNYIPGVTLGMRAYDTCSSEFVASRAISDFLPQISSSQLQCTTNNLQIVPGIVGGHFSEVTDSVGSMLRGFNIAEVSYTAGDDDLSDKFLFPNIWSTNPSPRVLAEGVAELVDQLQWEYTALVYTDDDAGESFKELILEETYRRGICIAHMIALPVMSQPSDVTADSLRPIVESEVVGVIYAGRDDKISSMFTALKNLNAAQVNRLQWVFSSVDPSRSVSSDLFRGSVSFTYGSKNIAEFTQYFANIDPLNPPAENPWFAEWYMTTNNCRLTTSTNPLFVSKPNCPTTNPTTRAANFRQHESVEPVIKAVYVLANALKRAQVDKCRGAVTLFCPNFKDMSASEYLRYVKQTDFTFSNLEGIPNLNGVTVAFDETQDLSSYEGFNVWNYNNKAGAGFTYEKVGSFGQKDGLTFNVSAVRMYQTNRVTPLATVPISKCMSGNCSYCALPSFDLDYFVTQPNHQILLGGIFPVHKSDAMRYTCKEIDVEGSTHALAYFYALQKAQQRFPNLDLAGMFVDSCNRGEILATHTQQFLSKKMNIRDQNNMMINPNNLIGYVDGLETAGSVAFANILQPLEFPDVGSRATGSQLQDEDMFPFYASTIPANKEQARSIVQFLMLTQFYYVQTVNAPNKHGRLGQMEFKMAANMESVCVAAEFEMNADGSVTDIIEKINKTPSAKGIVVFGSADDVEEIFEAIRLAGLEGKFVVFAASGWVRKVLPPTLDDAASGSFSISLQSEPVADFTTYLQSLNPTSTNIPFYSDLYEMVFSCSLDPQNLRRFSRICDPNQRLNLSPAYSETIQRTVSFTIKAVEVVAEAVNAIVIDICKTTRPCPAFFDKPDVREEIMEKIREILPTPAATYSYKILNYRPKAAQKFVEVATYDPTNRVTSLTSNPVILPNNGGLGSMVGKCSGFCQQCSYLFSQQPYMYTKGDINIGALVGISEKSTRSFVCGATKAQHGYQYAEAIRYTLEKINDDEASVKLHDVKLGSIIMDDCDSADRASTLLGGLYSRTFRPNDIDADRLRGWLTYSSDSTKESGKLLGELNVPVVSPFASALEFRNEETYPSLYLTVPRVDKMVAAMVQLIQALGFSYVQVLYSETVFGMSGMEEFEQAVKTEGICVVNTVKINPTDPAFAVRSLRSFQASVVVVITEHSYNSVIMNQISSGLNGNFLFVTSVPMNIVNIVGQKEISIGLQEPQLQDFKKYLSNQDGKFFRKYYEERFKCRLPQTLSSPFTDVCTGTTANTILSSTLDSNVLSTINAVEALAAAIHKTLQQQCGTNYTGVCTKFSLSKDTNDLIVDNLEDVTFKDMSGKNFFFNDRQSVQDLNILQRSGNDYVQVGSFSSGYLRLMDRDPVKRSLLQGLTSTRSACDAPCTICLQKSLDFTFIPGDVYIGGMFDVHTRSISPFTCGNVKTVHGFQLLEAFLFAVQRVNSKEGIFRGRLNDVTIGAIGMDSCESSVRTGYQISNIHNGRYALKKDGYEVDPENIKAYVAAYESDRTKYLARILNSLEIPQVSYGATSIELSDKERYPFFLRTVPSDDHQSDAILEFLDGQDMRYVQVLSSPTDYGKLGSQVFMERASQRRICIAQRVVFLDNGTITRESANDAVTTLLDKPLANIVVIFADTDYLNGFLLAVKRNSEAEGVFRFVGTIMWSLNFRMDPSVLDASIGAITLNLESADMAEFDKYLTTKTPANYQDNPWFDEYYEEIRDCSLRPPFGSVFQTKPACGTEFKSVVQASKYVQDPGVLHVVNSVYATALGMDYALRRLCGSNYTGVCEAFRSSGSTSNLILEGTEAAAFVDDTGSNFQFTPRRDGNKGYSLYSIEESMANENGYIYKKIGSFRNQSGLSMQSYKNDWPGSCDRPRVCTECPELRDSVTRYMEHAPGVGPNMITATIIGIFDLHKSQPHDEFLCGEMNHDSVFHNIMAFYYTLDKLVNNQPEFSSKIKINGIALDTCSSSIRVDSDLYGLISGKGLCHTVSNLGKTTDMSNIAAVITLGDDNTFAANRVLSPVKITAISPDAMSPMLENIERYNYLLRAKPPVSDQALAILALLRKMGWNYISAVYTTDHYGMNLFQTLMKHAATGNDPICIAQSLPIDEDGAVGNYMSTAKQLDEYGEKGARVVVLLTTKAATSKIITGLKSIQPNTKFILIGTDSWGVDVDIIKYQEAFLAGAITLKAVQPQVPSFKNFFAELSYVADRKNLPTDWFEEWYQHAHQCHLTNSLVELRETYQSPCQTNLLLNATTLQHDVSVYHTILSTYMVAKGLDDALKGCSAITLSDCLKNGADGFRSTIFSNTKDTEWENVGTKLSVPSQQDFNFRFNQMRYGNTGFQVNFVAPGDVGRLEYRELGYWRSVLNLGDVSYYNGMESKCLLKNQCSCAAAIAFGSQSQTDNAFGNIGDLPRNYFALDSTTYSNGTIGYTRIFDWPVWAIVMGVLTALGLLVCLVLFVLLICCYPVKSGTTILGFLLLVGIFGIYAINFAFFLPASVAVCGARRFVMGIVYAICFAALLVKAADSWRYTEFDTNPKKYKGITSALALLLIALFLIFIQVIIPVMWLLVDQPAAFLLSNSLVPHDFWWCGPPLFYDVSLVLSFIYVILLVFLTIIFAVLAWYNANNYYEARWILGVSICTAGIMMVWMIVSTMAAVPYRDAAVAIGNWVNATILLVCLPLRKTYLLFRYLREGSEDDMSEKDMHVYSTDYHVNQAFEPEEYQSKSAYDKGETIIYNTHGGEIVMQRPVVEQTSSAAMMSMDAREIGEQTQTMLVDEEETEDMNIVVESSGSAAVAAEAPPMIGEGLAVLQMGENSGFETTTHSEFHSSVREEVEMTYQTEYEYKTVEAPVETPIDNGPETVIITEAMTSGSEMDSDSDFSDSDSAGELPEGGLTRNTSHKKSLTKTYSYEVTSDEVITTTLE